MRHVELKDAFELIRNGLSIRQSKEKNGFPISRIETISDNYINVEKCGYAGLTDYEKYRKWFLKDGDILMSHINSVEHLGKIGIYEAEHEPIIHGMNLLCLRSNSGLFPKYAYYFFNSNYFKKQLPRITNKSVNQASFSVTKLKELKIPLPPLPIQQKIAQVLDRADALRQRNRQIIRHYDQLAQSVFLEMFGDPVKNPKGWEVKKLQNLGSWRSGGTPSRKKPEYFKGSIPWLSSGELEDIFCSKSNEFINTAAIENSAASIIKPYSLLLGMYDTAALKSTINTVECSCNQAIAFAKIDSEKANTVFLYYLIQIGKKHYRRLQRGVRQKNMNLSMIKAMTVLAPPLPLQNQFAQIIHRIEAQKQQQQQALAKSEELFQSLLQRAFKGELLAEAKTNPQMEMF